MAITIGLGFASARSYATSVPILILALIAAAPPEARPPPSSALRSPFLLCTFLYLGWAIFSSKWTEIQPRAGIKATVLTLILIGTWATVKIASSPHSPDRPDELRGLRVAFALGAAYLAADYLSGGWIKLTLTDNPRSIFEVEYTRGATSLPFLLGPLMASILWLPSGFWPRMILSVGPLIGVTAVFASPHETAKIATVALFVTTGLGYVARSFSHQLISAFWLTCCLAIVPASIALHDLGLKDANWLQASATDRIVIWHDYAQRTLSSPLIGHGASLSFSKPIRIEDFEKAVLKRIGTDDHSLAPRVSHPHNVFLQIWYELGTVGAILFAMIGITVLSAIKSMPLYARPLCYGSFAAGATQMLASYSIWQYWYVCLIGLSGILLALVFNSGQAHRFLRCDGPTR